MSSGSRRAPRSDFAESATPESSEAGVIEAPSPESGSDDDEPHKKPKIAASSATTSSARTLGLAKTLKQSKDLEKVRSPPAKRSVITFSFSSSIIIIIFIIILIRH